MFDLRKEYKNDLERRILEESLEAWRVHPPELHPWWQTGHIFLCVVQKKSTQCHAVFCLYMRQTRVNYTKRNAEDLNMHPHAHNVEASWRKTHM